KAQGAVQKLVASAKQLRIADWVELTVEERSITLTINEDAQTEAAKLDGRYVLKTDLTPHQAHKELVHDRYKDLASVGPRSWRRPPQLLLGEANTPQHQRQEAFEDADVMLSGHLWPMR